MRKKEKGQKRGCDSIVSPTAGGNFSEKKKGERVKETDAPLARRRAHECRVSSRALSKAEPHRTHEYAPVLTEWMCRWNVSARTPPSSSSHPRRGHRKRPSVRDVCSIASVASSLCGKGNKLRGVWGDRVAGRHVPLLRARLLSRAGAGLAGVSASAPALDAAAGPAADSPFRCM